jgi:hypothetical protein
MNTSMNILNQSYVLAVRRNHALEHATINILSKLYPTKRLAGYSDFKGFFILGDISLEDLQAGAGEALQRLNGGESNLAIHPNCGTNYVTMGLAVGAAAWLGLLSMKKDWRDRFDYLPVAMTLSTFAIMLAQPLGPKVQQYVTTSAAMGTLHITLIEKIPQASASVYRVHTQTG